MNGIFLLDKPINISSNHALQKVKRLFQWQSSGSVSDHVTVRKPPLKAGHSGTLDPLATGMLPIFLGKATKLTSHLLDADKTYNVTMQLGVRTNTSDAEGVVISTRDVPNFSLEEINSVLDSFRGKIQQIPSMFSALKHNGVPLYEYARKGMTIERQSRTLTIYSLIVNSFENNFVNFTVKCSKGTYVRTLVDDVGEKLNCGAHVTQLRRLSVGPFLENQMMTMEKLETLMKTENFSAETILLPATIFSRLTLNG